MKMVGLFAAFHFRAFCKELPFQLKTTNAPLSLSSAFVVTEKHRSHITFPQSPPGPQAACVSSPTPAGALPAARAHPHSPALHAAQWVSWQQRAEPWLGTRALKKKLQRTVSSVGAPQSTAASELPTLGCSAFVCSNTTIRNALFLLDFPLKARLLKHTRK